MIKSISEKICELRKARSLTQEKLGEQLGVSSQAVSKWEKGESLPDILILPRLCEILGVSVDALLEVPVSVKKVNCMDQLAAYSNEVGTTKAIFEAFLTCTKATDKSFLTGSSLVSHTGIRVCSLNGIGVIIDGEEQLRQIFDTDEDKITAVCNLFTDMNIIKVIKNLDFTGFRSANEIAEKSGLDLQTVEAVLFKLTKHNICEFNSNGDCVLGTRAYWLVTILTGIYLASGKGYQAINSNCHNYPPKEPKINK